MSAVVETAVVELELELELPALVPQPLKATVRDTKARMAQSAGQRRRRNPGRPKNMRAANVIPEKARVSGKPPRLLATSPEFVPIADARLLPVEVHALSEVFTVTEPFVTVPLPTLGFVNVKQVFVRVLGA